MKDKTWGWVDRQSSEYKSLKFRMLPNKDQIPYMDYMTDHSKWQWNMCVQVFLKTYTVKNLKKIIDDERESNESKLKEYKNKLTILNNEKIKIIKDDNTMDKNKILLSKDEEIKQHKKTKPQFFKINEREFRDSLRKYDYVEEDFSHTTTGEKIIIKDYVYNEERNSLFVPEYWKDKCHGRIPRGTILLFVRSVNSMISNYRNSKKNFSINYKTSKSPVQSVYLEDANYPKQINKIKSFFGYTTKERKRKYVSFKDISQYTKINSFVITYDRQTKEYYLNLSVPIDFYLPDDRHNENQVMSASELKVIALDPGVRTFLTGYGDSIVTIGEASCEEILKDLLKIDKIKQLISEGNENINDLLKERFELYRRIKNRVDDLHWKAIKYLTSNFKVIIYPDFCPKPMMKKLSKVTKRQLQYLSFYKFKERLKYKCKVRGVSLVTVNEAYTSRTCSDCGFLREKFCSKTFKCPYCTFKVDRDINGAKNILIKTIGNLQDWFRFLRY